MAISLISYFAKRRKMTTRRLRRRRIQSSAEASSEKSLFFVACDKKFGRYCYKFNPSPQIFKRKRKRCCSTNHHHHYHQLFNRRRVLEPLADGCGFRVYESSSYVAVGSIIYCIGGYRGRSMSPINTILYFDTTCPESGWKIGPLMIKPRARPLGHAIDGKLYVFGGGDDCKPWGEVFDPCRGGKWEALPEPPIRLVETISAVVVDQQGTTKTLMMVSEYGKLYGYNVLSNSWDFLFVDKSFGLSTLVRNEVHGPAVVLDNTLYWYSKRQHKHFIEAYDLEKRMWFTDIVNGLEWDGLVTPPHRRSIQEQEHWSSPSLLHLQRNLWCLVWEDYRDYKDSSGSTYRCIDSIKFMVTKRIDSRGYGKLDIQILSSQIHLIHPPLSFKDAFFM